MTYDQLLDFVKDYMPKRMQHIYLPLLVGELVNSDGSATIRQLAEAILAKDESQVIYYEKRLKDMPLRFLSKHDIITREGNLVSLNVKKLTFEQKSQIKMLCDMALREFIVKKGLGLQDNRLLDTDPLPNSLRDRVLKESDGRCALCGATKKERPLDVDHIKPRSKGGKNSYDNLQNLCFECNRLKGNKDDTNFRGEEIESVDDCPFCYENAKSRMIHEYNSVFVIKDGYPVSDGHVLIVPKRHSPDYFSLTEAEIQDANRLIQIMRKQISEKYAAVTGFNVGINSGESAGQTIFHCHIHLIPRRDGDTPNPRGGVRGVIPDKMSY